MNTNTPKKHLTMKCLITPVTGQDTSGDPTYGTEVSSVPCYIYGNTRRVRDTKQVEYVPGFQALFLASATIDNDYLIKDVYTSKNELILKSGVIVRMEKTAYKKNGIIIQQAYVERR